MGKELKRYTTVVLLMSILFQTFSPFIFQTEYFLNKHYIVTVLCVNKDKPKMRCNGKCYFAKRLQEQEKQERQAPTPKKVKFDAQPCPLPNPLSFLDIGFCDRAKYTAPSDPIGSTFRRSIFHPPAV